jgi:hypothetical protein
MYINQYLKKYQKLISVTLLLVFINQLFMPALSFALTSGPSQPEVQSFEPVGTTEMVDLFTGDFTYNIPLFELPGPNGGYPFNLAYHGGISMDQEASWVGLGWNLNPGAINRNMRGLPDDFGCTDCATEAGDEVSKTLDMKPNVTVGGGPGVSVELFGQQLSISQQLNIEYNNYRGYSSSIASDIGFSRTFLNGYVTPGASLSLNSSTADGASLGVNASLSLGRKEGRLKLGANLGTEYNSRRGLSSLNLGLNASLKNKNGGGQNKISGSGSVLSLAGDAYTPSIGNPMRGTSISVHFKYGVSPGAGIFLNGTLRGHYSREVVKDQNQEIKKKAFGYYYLGNGAGDDRLMDFNREKESTLTLNSRYLAIPSLSYDVYSVNGQGMAGMYRPFRADVGTVADPTLTSLTNGYTGGAEVGIGTGVHVGVDVAYNYNGSVSQRWAHENAGNFRFKPTNTNSLEENVYFKSYGEMSSNATNQLTAIGNKEPSTFRTSTTADNVTPQSAQSIPSLPEREKKNAVFLPITNAQLAGTHALGEFDIRYYPKQSTSTRFTYVRTETSLPTLSRTATHRKKNHFAGFITTNPDGMRYVYGLPAYNLEQVEYQATVSPPASQNQKIVNMQENGHKSGATYIGDGYKSETKMGSFPYAYLLTSVLGTDYVDTDGIPGPSDDDLGYWVKFTYEKKAGVDEGDGCKPFNWRAPFAGGNYNKGLLNKTSDDKASFMYGKKEVWYLREAETKSHIAIFYLNQASNISNTRLDAWGVSDSEGKFEPADGNGKPTKTLSASDNMSSYSLDKIRLYSKEEANSVDPIDDELEDKIKPIMTVHFEYSNALCRGVDNSINRNHPAKGGKLTLEKLYFTYEKSGRGALSPYLFDYGHLNADGSVKKADNQNPDYNSISYDRWGNYKAKHHSDDATVDESLLLDFPYVNQQEKKEILDQYAGAWNLKEITLPSGGRIKVEYETDDYAYVHNKVAMQMTPITGIEGNKVEANPLSAVTFDNQNSAPKVYFALDQEITDMTDLILQKEQIRRKYLDNTGQLYFKARVNLKEPGSNNYEWITAYLDIATDASGKYEVGVTPDKKHAYVQLKPITETVLTTIKSYHPISAASWQHLQQSQPEIIYVNNKISGLDASGPGNSVSLVQAVLASLKPFQELLKGGFYSYASGKKFGSQLDLSKAWIRLNNIKGKKYGGGSRVKQILLTDQWDESKSIYGQTYEYTLNDDTNFKDKDGKNMTISSGVAAYEPMIGGDEIALRRAEKYKQDLAWATDYDYYFEMPINEDLYPGQSVGYRKITVKSLASAISQDKTNAARRLTDEVAQYFNGALDKKFATTGAVCHEFYTTKDFPVISKASKIDLQRTIPYNIITPVGSIKTEKLAATQGYVTQLNDMHGKPKQVTYYAQHKDGAIINTPVSWVKYKYKEAKPSIIEGIEVRELDNVVDAINEDSENKEEDGVSVAPNTYQVPTKKVQMGIDYEFFMDARHHRNQAVNGGLGINFDMPVAGASFPVPGFSPSFSYNEKEVRTHVINKIIHQSGILEKVEAFDGSAIVSTENLVWDEMNGEVLLSTVSNNFGKPIYSYNIPARFKYDRMGAAYQNIGITLTSISFAVTTAGLFTTTGINNTLFDQLVIGDEFIVNNGAARAILVEKTSAAGTNTAKFYSKQNLAGFQPSRLFLYRSGRRNMLSAKVGSITGLKNPLTERKDTADPCLQELGVPCNE